MPDSFDRVIFIAALFVVVVGVSSSATHRIHRGSTSALTFPDDFKYCKADSSSISSSCLVDLIQDALIKLGTKGISSPIDFNINPMTLDFWTFHVEVDAVNTHEYFWDLKHPTLWNATVLTASFDPSNLTLTYTTYHDHIAQYNGRYKVWGQLYYDPDKSPEAIYGNGSADKHLYNVTLEHTVVFITADIKNTQYFFVGSYDVSVTGFTDAIFNFQNLYGGNESLAKRAADFLNENAAKIVFQQVDPFTEMLISMLRLYTQILVSSVPASRIFEHLAG